MKKNKVLLVIVLFMTTTFSNAQKIEELYSYVINDFYKEMLGQGIISEKDTMYLTFTFCDCDCADKNLAENIKLENNKIQFGMSPDSTAYIYNLSLPEFEKLSLKLYVDVYSRERGNKNFITYDGIFEYVFHYNKRQSRYVFESKQELLSRP